MTLVEVLVVLGLVLIFAFLLLPAFLSSPKSPCSIQCMNNQKQIGLALSVFAADHDGRYPPQVSITNGGSFEFLVSNSPALHFQSLSNYVFRNWRVFRCPADDARQPLRNVGYFLSVDATPRMTNGILAGDRNLEVAGQPVKPGFFMLTTNATVRWTRELHSKAKGTQSGSILFADTHVEFLRTNLSAVVQRRGLAPARLAVP